ncbi:MAG: hypothetical protein K1X88_34295 [Nannocystaceae bacterium]|nr:hypothetical protein [Nannocystaceae bacterium]
MNARWSMVFALLGACTEPGAAPTPAADSVVHESSARSAWINAVAPSDPSLTELAAEVVGDASARTQLSVTYPSKVVAIRVRVGDAVKAGDVLIEVLVPELVRAQATATSAADRIELQRKRIDQLEALRGEGLVGGRELFELRAGLAELEAQRREAQAIMTGAGLGDRGGSFERGLLRLRAPADGTVTAIEAVVGEMHDGTSGPLVSLARESAARIEVHAMQPLPPGASLHFTLPDGRELELAQTPIATAVDPSDGSLRLWFDPATPTRLPHGVRGHVSIRAVQGGALQVPERAIAWQDGRMVVFVREGEGARAVPVEVVGRSGSSALVRGEIAIGDPIAGDGAAWITPAEDHE